MTDEERDALRNLQDRWLSLAVVQHQIRNHGEGEHIAGPDSPTCGKCCCPTGGNGSMTFLCEDAK